MAMRAIAAALLALATCPPVQGRSDFQQYIPNGDKVKFDMGSGPVPWPGVGHFAIGGGGPKNNFGNDFVMAGYTWSYELCMKDSDGDGETNGEELGDPLCIWKRGDTPSRTTDIGHPGLATLTAAQNDCYQQLNKDKKQPGTCPPKAADIIEQKFTMGGYQIPVTTTTYIAKAFTIPMDKKYHVTHMKPLIDKSVEQYVHHYQLFGCSKAPDTTGYGTYFPKKIAMDCGDELAAWAAGSGDWESCHDEQMGVAIGKDSGIVSVVLEVHYENAPLTAGLVDNSGVSLFYTPTLRPAEAGILSIGKLHLDGDFVIKPGYQTYHLSAECPGDCTSKWPHPINVFGFRAHMHTIGKKMWVEHYGRQQDGTLFKKGDIGKTGCFSSSLPSDQEISPPVVVEPGDVLVTTCSFDSRVRSADTTGGDGSKYEMCYGFLDYYPKIPGMNFCMGSPDKAGGDISPNFQGMTLQVAACGESLENLDNYVGDFVGDRCAAGGMCDGMCAGCKQCLDAMQKHNLACDDPVMNCCNCWDTTSFPPQGGQGTVDTQWYCLSTTKDSCIGCWDPNVPKPIPPEVNWAIDSSCRQSCGPGGYCEVTSTGVGLTSSDWKCIAAEVAPVPVTPEAPVFNPGHQSTVAPGSTASMTSVHADRVCYSLDGSNPACVTGATGFDDNKCIAPAEEFRGPIAINNGMTINAVGCGAAGQGPMSSATYTVSSKTWPTTCDCSSGSNPFLAFDSVRFEWCVVGDLQAGTGTLYLRAKVLPNSVVALQDPGSPKYVALGIGGSSMTSGADVIVVDSTGVVSDRQTKAKGVPPADAGQDVSAFSFATEGNGWTVEMERPVAASDANDKAIADGTQEIMIAYGLMSGVDPQHHVARQSSTIQWCPSPSQPPSRAPSQSPSASPSKSPSKSPQAGSTVLPSSSPSRSPSMTPSASPSMSPQPAPTKSPLPPNSPTESPLVPSISPSSSPSTTRRSPSASPQAPTESPSAATPKPTTGPLLNPTKSPRNADLPTESPTQSPSSPVVIPSTTPKGPEAGPPTQSPSTTDALRNAGLTEGPMGDDDSSAWWIFVVICAPVLIAACGISVWLFSRKSKSVEFKNIDDTSVVSMSHQYGNLELKDKDGQETRISSSSEEPVFSV